MPTQELRLGTRGSQLALWQANTVAARIAAAGGPPCRIVVIKTDGDRLQERPLSEMGGKGLFVKEIEDALLGNAIDLAVHSSKDMSAVLPEGLTIAGVLPRENPLDAVVLPVMAKGSELSMACKKPWRSAISPERRRLIGALGAAPSIGTGSVRRVAQLMRLFPGARFAGIRGNLDTRLRKLDEGAHDALVLAAAGLARLGFASRISLAIPAEACVPAPGQGIVAIEIRAGDARAPTRSRASTTPPAGDALTAERALVEALGGGCQTPVGALASVIDGKELELDAVVVALDGSRVVRGQARGARHDAAKLGARVGAQLIADGAGEILAEASGSREARSAFDVRRSSLRPANGEQRPTTNRTTNANAEQNDERRTTNDERMSIVYLIGAGPGDPGLITVRGLQYLSTADVVLYDHLVPPRLLRAARPDAEQIDVGTAAPQPLEQEAICYLLAEKAREGKMVAD